MLNSAFNKTEASPEVQAAKAEDEDPVVNDVGPEVHRVTRALWVAKLAALALGYGAILLFFISKI